MICFWLDSHAAEIWTQHTLELPEEVPRRLAQGVVAAAAKRSVACHACLRRPEAVQKGLHGGRHDWLKQHATDAQGLECVVQHSIQCLLPCEQ